MKIAAWAWLGIIGNAEAWTPTTRAIRPKVGSSTSTTVRSSNGDDEFFASLRQRTREIQVSCTMGSKALCHRKTSTLTVYDCLLCCDSQEIDSTKEAASLRDKEQSDKRSSMARTTVGSLGAVVALTAASIVAALLFSGGTLLTGADSTLRTARPPIVDANQVLNDDFMRDPTSVIYSADALTLPVLEKSQRDAEQSG